MHIDQNTSLKSQLAIITGLLVFGWLFDWTILIPIATVLALGFLLLPSVGNLIAKGWLKLALFLGHWNGRILLSLVFFLFLTPIAWVYRLFNRPSTQAAQPNSNWVARNHTFTASDLDKTW